MIDVITFYDEHPINEAEIESKLAAAGKRRDALEPEDLYPFDQDHYGGLEATDALAAALGLDRDGVGARVLDVCSGMGGTSRYLARRYRCRVHGVDLNPGRVAGAERLTRIVGLSDRVSFEQGDAARLGVAPGGFDAAIAQEAFLHIPAKEGLLAGCFAALRPGGRLGFTDWIARRSLSVADRARFAATFAAERIVTLDAYRALLEAAGFRDVTGEDLSAAWRVVLHDRLEMFRSLEAETVRRFGRARHETYITNYEFFVARIDAGDLGGARFVARRPDGSEGR